MEVEKEDEGSGQEQVSERPINQPSSATAVLTRDPKTKTIFKRLFSDL